ncbi:hypothetical protein PCURB6_35610 [Paenibacillus curdlanolyticus]|nr:hypothetical protein PCURB6_35610 [Paenibacillus curdlanolyticus]
MPNPFLFIAGDQLQLIQISVLHALIQPYAIDERRKYAYYADILRNQLISILNEAQFLCTLLVAV